MILPLNYIDLMHLESSSYFIMANSSGIQEEGISIGKPTLVIRENAERPKAIKSGNEVIEGSSFNKIYYFATSLLKNKEVYIKWQKLNIFMVKEIQALLFLK